MHQQEKKKSSIFVAELFVTDNKKQKNVVFLQKKWMLVLKCSTFYSNSRRIIIEGHVVPNAPDVFLAKLIN